MTIDPKDVTLTWGRKLLPKDVEPYMASTIRLPDVDPKEVTMTDEKDLGFPERRKPVFRERGDYDEENVFTYHKPGPDDPAKYVNLRACAKQLALLMRELCPPGRELALARTKLEESVMWANAAIARHGK